MTVHTYARHGNKHVTIPDLTGVGGDTGDFLVATPYDFRDFYRGEKLIELHILFQFFGFIISLAFSISILKEKDVLCDRAIQLIAETESVYLQTRCRIS